MLKNPLSKILLGVVFKLIMDFMSDATEADEERKQAQAHARDTEGLKPQFRKTLLKQNDIGDTHMDSQENESTGFGAGLLLATLFGGVIGASLALWYAPQSGKKTQAMLKRRAGQVQNQVNKRAHSLYSSAEEMASDAAERATEWTEHGREFVEDKANSLKKAMAREGAAR